MRTSEYLSALLCAAALGTAGRRTICSIRAAAWKAHAAGLRSADVWVRSGKVAVLVFEGEFIRMTLPVLCLQSGGRGQRVRVVNRETKRTYLARVTGPGVVTSVLSD